MTKPPGYTLRVAPDELDLTRFERLVAEARRPRPGERVRLLREALALWRGPPLADLEYDAFAEGEIRRLEELRLDALEERSTPSSSRAPAPSSSASSSRSSRAPAARAAARPADARALPLGTAGGGDGASTTRTRAASSTSSESSRAGRSSSSTASILRQERTLDPSAAQPPELDGPLRRGRRRPRLAGRLVIVLGPACAGARRGPTTRSRCRPGPGRRVSRGVLRLPGRGRPRPRARRRSTSR